MHHLSPPVARLLELAGASWMLGSAACLSALCSVGACGGKSELGKYHMLDDAGTVGGGTSVLEVECGRFERYSSPGRSIAVEATATSPYRLVWQQWTLAGLPAESTAALSDTHGATATLVPDTTGDYALAFAARDEAGNSASCNVRVHSIVGPPAAICPEDELLTRPGAPIAVQGDGYDDVAVVAYRWSVASAPPGAATPALAPLDQPVTHFTAEAQGRYELSLTVFDGDTSSDSCLAVVHVAPPPVAICPEGSLDVPTRVESVITGQATGSVGELTASWQLVERPPGSSASVAPTTGTSTRLVADRQGEYRLRLTVRDGLGQQDSCDVLVVGLPTPPSVTCSARVETRPLVVTPLSGSAQDDGRVVSYHWSLLQTPVGSAALPPEPASSATTQFAPDIAGVYQLELVALDDDGQMGTCASEVVALATEGLRLELFWDAAPDMDLHLLHPNGSYWHTDLDCHYGNCRVPGLNWYPGNPAANPRLDVDDMDGYGPENINIDEPEPGIYRVGAHAYTGSSRTVNLRVYCGGSETVPRASYGPVELPSDYFWRIVDVEITGGGCVLHDLSLPDGTANIEADYSGENEPR
jgi:hypothetical protein